MKYFTCLDTETGGIGLDKSLLTAYYGFYIYENQIFRKLDDLYLKIKPDDGIYKVTAEALSINKIDLIEHDKVAIFEKAAGTLLYNKLKAWSDVSKEKITPVGHNVAFDIAQTGKLVSKGSWDNFVSYRTIDTGTLAQVLRLTGKIPDNIAGGLGHIAAYYKVSVSGKAHEAPADVEMTIGVLEKMMLDL